MTSDRNNVVGDNSQSDPPLHALGAHQSELAQHVKLCKGTPERAGSFAELKCAVEKGLSKAGLMLFMQLDQGAVVRKETGQDTPRIIRLLIGNPLIVKEMAKHVPDAGSYAPVTVLVDERADGVHLSYDGIKASKEFPLF